MDVTYSIAPSPLIYSLQYNKRRLQVLFVLLQSVMVAQEIANLEGTVAAMQSDFEKTLNANMASQKDLQDNLVSAKHDLLRIQEQLALAEKVITIITLWFLPFKGTVHLKFS